MGREELQTSHISKGLSSPTEGDSEKFYPLLEIANSPISKSNLLCKFACSFSLGDLMLANIDSVCKCSFILIFFFVYQYFKLYDTICYAVNFVLIGFV